jgi:hypothetical protein
MPVYKYKKGLAKGLTLKQKGFAERYVANNGNGQEAVKAVYDVKSDEVACTVASENIRKPQVLSYVEYLLEGTEDKVKQVIFDGLDANLITEYQGEATLTNLPNYAERRKMASLIADIQGLKVKKVETKNLTVALDLNKLSEAELDALLKSEMEKLK